MSEIRKRSLHIRLLSVFLILLLLTQAFYSLFIAITVRADKSLHKDHLPAINAKFSDWNYQLPLYIVNNNSYGILNYDAKIVVNTKKYILSGMMRTDCGDVRFSDEKGNSLPYWIQPNTCNTNETIIWVKVPYIPPNSTTMIYMYYGNPSATSESNANEVFLFFDDFSGTSLNTKRWSIIFEPSSNAKINAKIHYPTFNVNNGLVVNVPDNCYYYVFIPNCTFIAPVVAEMYFRIINCSATSNFITNTILTETNSSAWYFGNFEEFGDYGYWSSSDWGLPVDTSWHLKTMIIENETQTSYLDGQPIQWWGSISKTNPTGISIKFKTGDETWNHIAVEIKFFFIATFSQNIEVSLAPSTTPPTLILYNPQINGLTVTVNGTATPGYSGASITKIHWDWGDKSSEDHSFPASHTYSNSGTYTITVTAYQSDGLSTTKTVQVKVESPSISIFVPVDNFMCKLGTSFPILLTVEDHQGNLIDATVNCKVLTPKGSEIFLDLSRIATGVYATSFTGTTEVGDYRIIITAQKPGYASDTKELTLHVQGQSEYGITEISRTSARFYFIRGPSEAIIKVDGEVTKEDDHFNIDFSLINTRDAYYDVTIYSMPPSSPSFSPQLKILYKGLIQPDQVLYPVRIEKVPVYSGEVSYIAVHVEMDFVKEFLKTLADLTGTGVFGDNRIAKLIGSISDLNCYREEFVALESKLESYMMNNGYLPGDYSNLDSYEKALEFSNGFKKLSQNEPEYVIKTFLEAAAHCSPNIAENMFEASIESNPVLMNMLIEDLGKILFIANDLLEIYHYASTPSEEIIYIKIGKVSSSNMASRTSLGAKNFLFAINSMQPLNGATDFSLQKYLGNIALASISNSQSESNTTGSITINLFKDRLTYKLDALFPVSEPMAFESIDIFSMTSNGIRKGEFIVANATINFVFSDNETASYFFEIVNSSSPMRETILKLTGFNVAWNAELHINGSSVYLRATGLKPASPGLTQEDWTEVVKADQVSLNIFREFEVQNVENNSYITRRLISPEVFSVASAYSDRIIVRLFTAPKIGILAVDPKPTFCEGDPEIGYECSWSQVLEELTLSYIVDEAPPVISKIEQDPKTVTFENDVTVTVNVSDVGVGLKNVTVAYSTNNGATWKKLKAEQVAGDIHQGLFKAVIPKQPYGTSVAYKLEVYDRAGNVEQSDTITYQVELALWVYGLVIVVIMLAIIIGYEVYHAHHHHFA